MEEDVRSHACPYSPGPAKISIDKSFFWRSHMHINQTLHRMDYGHFMKLGLSVVLFVSAPFWGASTVSANPVGGAVQAGAATITQKGPWLTVNQGSDKVIIDWNSF